MEKICGRCGYEWESRKKNPKECPRCKARLDVVKNNDNKIEEQ